MSREVGARRCHSTMVLARMDGLNDTGIISGFQRGLVLQPNVFVVYTSLLRRIAFPLAGDLPRHFGFGATTDSLAAVRTHGVNAKIQKRARFSLRTCSAR